MSLLSSSVVSCLPKGGERSRATSMVSLTVETALGSFDFLNASDWEEEEEDNHHKRHSSRPVPTHMRHSRQRAS